MKRIQLARPRVIVHNLTWKGIENVPAVMDFDQRGILFARPGDMVATKRPPEQTFLSYLESLGWDFSQVTFVSPLSLVDYTYKSIFLDKHVDQVLKTTDFAYIDTYHNTMEEEKFSKRLSIPLYATPKIGQRYGTKSGFRKLAKQLRLPIVRGYESIRGADELLRKCLLLFAKGVHTVVVKIDEGVSGAGQTHLHKKDFIARSNKEQLDMLDKAIALVPQLDKKSAVIVEEWIDDVVASPSIQLEVTPQKEIRILSIHDQLLEGVEKWYVGCIYPQTTLSQTQLDVFTKQALLFTKALVKDNFQGFLGIDSIITKKGEIIWVEANVRKPGTFYPRIIAEKLNGGSLGEMYYIACDFTVPSWKGKSFSYIYQKLSPFLYPIKKEKYGVVLYNTGALLDAGRFDVVCIGRSLNEAKDLFGRIKAYIKQIKL